MEEDLKEFEDNDFLFELFLSTDGKHTVHVKAETAEGRKHALGYAKKVYDRLEEAYGKKGVMKHKDEFAASLFADQNCPVHGVTMLTATSKKTGRPYQYHRGEGGEMCFGKGFKELPK